MALVIEAECTLSLQIGIGTAEVLRYKSNHKWEWSQLLRIDPPPIDNFIGIDYPAPASGGH